jgi:hypothetical protein
MNAILLQAHTYNSAEKPFRSAMRTSDTNKCVGVAQGLLVSPPVFTSQTNPMEDNSSRVYIIASQKQ